MSRFDLAELLKGTLAGWSVDPRDPLADKRLVEYCLSVPTDEYLFNGVPRALARRAFADRLPAVVLNERKRGLQGADWYEGLTGARTAVGAELDRLACCAPAAQLLDIDKMKRLVENWPTSGWERDDVEDAYRLALLRGIAAGHFLRKASGAN
jgi:asparagine synthase (glutamine-hydrolysing)